MTGLATQDFINQELKKFPITDAAIDAMRQEYMGLTVASVEDKEGYKKVRESRIAVKGKRCAIESERKILISDALKFQQAINGEAKRITGLLEPIETYLEAEEDKYDKWVEEVKQAKEREEQERLQGRVAKLLGFGMTFDGNLYKRGDILIPAILLKSMDDLKYTELLAQVKTDYDSEQFRIAEEARIKKEEEDRIAAEKAEAERKEQERKAEEDRLRKIEDEKLAAERAEIERIKKEQAEKEAAIKAAQDKIDAEKKAIEDQKRKEDEDKRHAEEIEKAKQESAEQARKDEQARVEREVREKEERDRLAAIEAEEKKAQMTDKEKLKDLLAMIKQIDIPKFKSKKAGEVGRKVGQCFIEACDYIREAL